MKTKKRAIHSGTFVNLSFRLNMADETEIGKFDFELLFVGEKDCRTYCWSGESSLDQFIRLTIVRLDVSMGKRSFQVHAFSHSRCVQVV